MKKTEKMWNVSIEGEEPVEVYDIGGYVQRIAVDSIKPTTPKYKNLEDVNLLEEKNLHDLYDLLACCALWCRACEEGSDII